jgi:hypothetical protein
MDDPSSVDLNPAELLAAPPNEDYALLELELAWTDLDPAQERIAASLRSFVVTRDPLDWIPARGHAWATANADGDVLELVVYVALDAVRDAVADDGNVAAALGRYCEAAVRAGAAAEGVVVSGAQPALATAGRAPRLLDALDDAGTFGIPTVRVASHGWEPLGLGAIQDLVQDAFGPVDFDRSLVRLDPVEPRVADCAACRGERFGFPADLETARPLLCSPPRGGARGHRPANHARPRVQRRRLARDQQGVGQDPRPARARRAPAAPTYRAVSGSQRPVPVRQRPQVQALLRRLTALDLDA